MATHGGGVIKLSWWVESNYTDIMFVAPPIKAEFDYYNLTINKIYISFKIGKIWNFQKLKNLELR